MFGVNGLVIFYLQILNVHCWGVYRNLLLYICWVNQFSIALKIYI